MLARHAEDQLRAFGELGSQTARGVWFDGDVERAQHVLRFFRHPCALSRRHTRAERANVYGFERLEGYVQSSRDLGVGDRGRHRRATGIAAAHEEKQSLGLELRDASRLEKRHVTIDVM